MKTPFGEWDESRTALLKNALKAWLKKSGVGWMLSHRELVAIWQRCVGEEIAAETRPAGWSSGTLTVDVFSPVRKAELEGFFSAALLETIKAEAPELKVRKIRFRLASPEAYETAEKKSDGENGVP